MSGLDKACMIGVPVSWPMPAIERSAMFRAVLCLLALVSSPLCLAIAQTDEPLPPPEAFAETGMTPERMGELLLSVDPETEQTANGFLFTISDRDMLVVYDANADRMRIVTPIGRAEGLPSELYERMLQANYDAVLDARYAIGNGMVWSVFIHPLASLSDEEFLSGMAQVVISAETFGSTFTSGVFVFGGGDTQSLHDELLRELEELQGGDERGI